MTTASNVRILDQRTPEERDRSYLPGMGRTWLLPFYDALSRLAGVRALHERAIEIAGIAPAQAVLDVGCGTGNLSFTVLAAQPDARVTGLDHVVSSLALHHVDDDDRTAFARDALRALRPGGKITVVDFGGPAEHTDAASHSAHGHGPARTVRHLPALIRTRIAPNLPVPSDVNGIVTLLEGAGFGDAHEVAQIDHQFGRVTFVQATRSSSSESQPPRRRPQGADGCRDKDARPQIEHDPRRDDTHHGHD